MIISRDPILSRCRKQDAVESTVPNRISLSHPLIPGLRDHCRNGSRKILEPEVDYDYNKTMSFVDSKEGADTK